MVAALRSRVAGRRLQPVRVRGVHHAGAAAQDLRLSGLRMDQERVRKRTSLEDQLVRRAEGSVDAMNMTVLFSPLQAYIWSP